jgi:arginyl-tRNA synthetase
MFDAIRIAIADAVRAAAREKLGAEIERIALERPPKAALGDLASPVAFDLAKSLRKAPRAIAGELAAAVSLPEGVREARVEGAGYLNFFLDRGGFVRRLLTAIPAPTARPGKVIVEHTNINPNKAAHIGHLRNAVLGDVLVRTLRHLGREVEVQNYLDDTGVQVADVVAGLIHLQGVRTVDAVHAAVRDRRLPQGEAKANPKGFAYLCWDLYAEVGRTYAEKPETKAWREEVLHAIEAGENETARVAAAVVEAVASSHVATMGRLGIAYDLLPRESDILHKHFWATAFDLLKKAGAIHQETEGKHAGCWVLPLSESEEFAGMEEPDKILVRSNGTVTYTGKDIAYQLWKFGLLPIDFDYVPFAIDWGVGSVPAGEIPAAVREHPVWRSAHAGGAPNAPRFGHGSTVINVIDVRQSYLQKVVKEGLRTLGYPAEADRSTHFSYEIVALSPKAARELAERFGEEYRLSPEDEKKPYVEMSGRKGLGVKADDLVELLLERSRREVESRRGESRGEAAGAAASAEEDARAIAVGALRYFLLKVGRNKVIAFDFDEALNFEGDTGPYLQYSLVRAGNIFRKLREKGIDDAVSFEGVGREGEEWTDDLWAIALDAASIPDAAERSVDALEPATLARHAFGLAQAFNHFYHRQPILQETDAAVRNRRLAIARIFEREMSRLLELLGIPQPGRM